MGLEEGILKQVEEYGIEKGIKTMIFRLFDNGFDVLQVSEMLKMEMETIEKFKVLFDNQPEIEGDAKTDEQTFESEEEVSEEE
jgi:hypothetical protein